MKHAVFEPVCCHLYWLARQTYLRCLQSEAQRDERIGEIRAELDTCRGGLQNDDPKSREKYDEARQELMRWKTMIQPDAVTAVILSAATLEGFINGLGEYGHWRDSDRASWGTALYEAKEKRRSVACKYFLISRAVGQPFVKGAQPYKDFRLLIKLRNTLVHPKQLSYPDENGVTKPSTVVEVLERITGRAALDSKHRHSPPGYNEICSTAVAKWACNTTSEMIHAVLDMLPDGTAKEAFEIMFCKMPDGRGCFPPIR